MGNTLFVRGLSMVLSEVHSEIIFISLKYYRNNNNLSLNSYYFEEKVKSLIIFNQKII